MLWDLVYSFYVQYIFGGRLGSIDNLTTYWVQIGANPSSGAPYYSADTFISLFGENWAIGNYFAFIATIITMVAIVLICCALIKKIYNMCAHIIG